MRKAHTRSNASCEGFLRNDDNIITAERLHQMLGLAVKYILPEEHWDFKGTVEIRVFREITFEARPSVKSMVELFVSRGSVQMRQKTPLNDCLKWLVGYDKGLSNPRCKPRTRIKRLSMVARDFKKRLRERNRYDLKAGQGVLLFTYSIKKQFLGRGKE